MKVDGLVLSLLVSALLTACGRASRPNGNRPDFPKASTIAEGFQMAEDSVATIEKAFESASEDAIKQAAFKLSNALIALAEVVCEEDAELLQCHLPLPTARLPIVEPSLDASDRLLSAVIPPDQDFEAAKKHLAELKHALADARKDFGL